jgi:hypothetical protein
MRSFKKFVEDKGPCWTGYRQVGMKKKGNRMVPNCVPEEFNIREANEGSQVTVGDYTTKHFDICPSAVALYSKIKDMTPMVHLIVENMMLHDVFFRLEKQAIAQGLIDDDDLDKAAHYADMIMDNAEQMGLEEEHSYIGDVHMKKFMELAGLDDDEEDLEEDEGSVKRNRELLSTGRISKDEFDRRMGYGKYKKSKDPSNKRLDGPGGLYKNLVKRLGEEDLDEGAETWEAGYKRRVVKTTDPEHKEKGMNWRIKGKDRPEISIKLYKEKPSQAEFNKQMRRVAGHEFGG